MTLLIPLGLLGLLGVVALIIIYIIKPNYQQKAISSTFIWKLSLKYKKRKLPTSTLRNLLLILCQVLILTICAFILTKPSTLIKTQLDESEVIIILDASSSMRAVNEEEESRFERAVEKSIEKINEVFENDGIVSVIFADNNPSYLIQRATKEKSTELIGQLEELVDEDACTYGSGDIDGSLELSEEMLQENPYAQVVVYTDKAYTYIPDGIEVVEVTDSEWNTAILNAYAELEDNYYNFVVDVACYGRNEDVTVEIEVYGANAADLNSAGTNIRLTTTVLCENDTPKRLIFRNADKSVIDIDDENTILVDIFDADKVFSYQSIHITVGENDSYQEDDNFDIYGGQKEVIKIAYTTKGKNPFMLGVLDNLRSSYRDRWDIQITEVNTKIGEEYDNITEGYDVYVYEHYCPEIMPKDGLVIFVDPDVAPNGAGFRVNSYYDLGRVSQPLQSGFPHVLMNNVIAENITVTRFSNITYLQSNYDILMGYNGRPILMAKNDGPEQVVIFGLNPHYSNLPITVYWPMIFRNIMEYYLPSTVIGNAFEVNQTININARGDEVVVEGYKTYKPIVEFPATVSLEVPGMYNISQTTYFGKEVTESIYVKVPADESNLWKEEDTLYKPQLDVDYDSFFNDLLLYFAIGLVALLFAEWWLHMHGSNI